MTTYRERREARAERLREWADKREAKSAAAFDTAHEMADRIPFGQPILVGHHSQHRAERDRDRIGSAMDRGVEHSRKAESMNSRAANIESQLAGAIYSDDEDAIEQLAARVARLEAERDRIKAYNASCRKGARDVTLLDEKQQRDLAAGMRVGVMGAGGQFPSYHLTNLSGNIARNRKRLESLRRKAT
jgi:hypothetical protein